MWDLNNNKINTFNFSWRKAVRRLWLVSYRTHRFLLPDLKLGKDFLKIIIIRFISFAYGSFTSLNVKISFIGHVVCMSPLHSFCNNLHLAYNTFAHSNPLCRNHTALSNVLCELLCVRNGCFNISIFSSSDINDLITNICCNWNCCILWEGLSNVIRTLGIVCWAFGCIGCAFNYIFFVICIMLLDAIAMYVLLPSYKGRNKGININTQMRVHTFTRTHTQTLIRNFNITRINFIYYFTWPFCKAIRNQTSEN